MLREMLLERRPNGASLGSDLELTSLDSADGVGDARAAVRLQLLRVDLDLVEVISNDLSDGCGEPTSRETEERGE